MSEAEKVGPSDDAKPAPPAPKTSTKKKLLWYALCAAAFPFLGDCVVAYRMPKNDIPTRVAAAKKLGVPFDSRSTFARYEALRAEDPQAVPLVTPLHSSLEIDGKKVIPVGAVSRAKTLVCNEGGDYAIYDSDEHGFHNPRGLEDHPVEVVFLGGSLVQGSCVRTDETIAAHARRAHPSLVSLGMADTGPLMQLAALSEVGPRLKPKVVVWMFDRTDPDDLAIEAGDPIVRRYLEDGFSQHLLDRQEEIDRGLRVTVEKKLAEARAAGGDLNPPTNTVTDVLMLRHLRRLLRRPNVDAQMPLLKTVLARGKAIVEQWGGKLLLAYLPDYVECGASGQELPAYRPYLAVTKDLDMPVVDLMPVFRRQPDPAALFPLRIRGHYNSDGYKLVAETINAEIAKLDASK